MVLDRIKGHGAKHKHELQDAALEAARQRGLKQVVLDSDATIRNKVAALRGINDHWFISDRVMWAGDRDVRLAAIERMGEESFKPERGDADALISVSRGHFDPKTREAAASQAERIHRMLDAQAEPGTSR